jgi:hypothetical protein
MFLEKTYTGVSTDVIDKLAEYKGPLLADMLRTIILLTTYLPTILVDCGDSSQKDRYRRTYIQIHICMFIHM